ncbi:MAG: AAA family ATPase [Oceanospirillaceae bacterium]|nr:AAA family ATPase [Oceanospirillaceae bacterium]
MSDNLYFEPPSRLQLVDKLVHLLRFSNVFMVVVGPMGAGVSTTIDQLYRQIGEDDVYILSLNLKNRTNLQTLLKLLNSAMDQLLAPVENEDSDLFSVLHGKIEALAKLQRKLLITIDNADFLSDEATESLLNLIQASQSSVGIVLGGSPDLVQAVTDQITDPSVSELIHNELLEPFNRLETEEFIQLSFVRGGDFSARQLSDIYLKSQGYPGLILQLTNEMIKSGKITLSGKSSLLPVPHIIGIAVLVTAIITVSSWQYFSEGDMLEDETSLTSELELKIEQEDGVEVAIAAEVAEHNVRASALELQISSLASKIEAQEMLLETAREDLEQGVEPIKLEPILTPSAEIESLTASNTIDQPQVEVSDQAEAKLESSTSDVSRQPSVKAKVEVADVVSAVVSPVETVPPAVIVKEKVAPIKAAITAAKPTPDKIKEPPAVIIKQLVLSEPLPSIEQSLHALTAEIQENIPAELLTEIPKQSKVMVQESSFNLNTSAETVASIDLADKGASVGPAVSTAVTNKAVINSPAKLSRQSLVAWPVTGYTLQLLGARSENRVLKFLKSAPNAENIRYFQTTLKNKPWIVVVYGQYATRTAANAAKKQLPAKLKQLNPWVKSIKSVQNDINN